MNSVSIFDILLLIVKNIKVILITSLIAISTSLFYVKWIADPVFASTSKIRSSSGSSSNRTSGLAAQFGISIPGELNEKKWVYPEILKSKNVIGELLKKEFATIEFGISKSLLKILTHENESSNYSNDRLQVIGIQKFLKMLEVHESAKTGIHTIRIYAKEAKFAQELNASLIQELERYQSNFNKSSTSKTRKFIEERILEIRKELNKAEEDLKDFTTKNRRFENSPLLKLERDRLSRDVIVLNNVFTTLRQQLETTKIEEVRDSDYVIVVDPPSNPLYPSAPRTVYTIIITNIIALGFLFIFLFLKEFYFKNNLKDKKKLNKALDLLKDSLKIRAFYH